MSVICSFYTFPIILYSMALVIFVFGNTLNKWNTRTQPIGKFNWIIFFNFVSVSPIFDKHFSLFCRVRIFTANVLVNDEQEKNNIIVVMVIESQYVYSFSMLLHVTISTVSISLSKAVTKDKTSISKRIQQQQQHNTKSYYKWEPFISWR